jgi:hypothetical protein
MGFHQIEPLANGCAKAYQFSRVRKIKKYEAFLNPHLAIGSLLHAGRAQWLYDKRTGDNWKTQIILHADKLEKEGEKLPPQAVSKAVSNFEGYRKFWLNPHRPRSTVLAVEYAYEPRGFSPEATAAGGPFLRTSRLDSIERWSGGVWIGEAKSTYAGGAARVKDMYELHPQIMLQISLWGETERTKFGPLAGVLLDPMVKEGTKKGEEIEATGADRIPVSLDKIDYALRWFKRDLFRWIDAARQITWNSDVERRNLCRTCEFKPLCSKGRDGSAGFVFSNGLPIAAWKPSKGKETPPWE